VAPHERRDQPGPGNDLKENLVAEWLSSLRHRLRAMLWRQRLDQDLHDEMAFHIAMREAQLRAAGAADAGSDARRRFGSRARIREELRDAWAVAPGLAGFAQDLRYALRTLRRYPGFAIAVAVTLALGIGINTATFSIVNAALIRPLGFADPDRLVALQEQIVGFEFDDAPFSPPDFLDVQRDQQSFVAVAAFLNASLELSDGGEPVRIDAAKVSATLFPLLGTQPLLGRTFTTDEDRPGSDVAVLSWPLWQTRFGGDPAIVGRTITLDRRPYAVVGVMPGTFEFPRRGPVLNNKPADVWVPMAFTEQQRQARGNQFTQNVIGRLKPGISLDQARAELSTLAGRINASYPPGLRSNGFSIDLSAVSLRDQISGRAERPLLLLLAAVGIVLLVTCSNVANLILSRAASRTKEIAVRLALGSSRARVLRLLFVEAAVLAAAGGLLGLAVSTIVVRAVPASVTETLPAAGKISLDARVLAFSTGAATLTAIVFALLPLLGIESGPPGSALQEESARTTPGVRRHRLQSALVVSTVILAFVLLVGAGLFIRSFAAVMATESGFRPTGVLTAATTLPRAGYSTAASVRSFHASLFREVSSLPGVRSAALVTDLPLESYERRTFAPEAVNMRTTGNTNLTWVYGPFFDTLGIEVTRGRPFSDVETTERRQVVIVNERLARTVWPGQDPIGRRMRWGLDTPENPNPWLTVVGVVGDVVDGPLEAPTHLHAYEPFSQFPDGVLDNVPNAFGRHVKVAVRTDGSPRALASALRSTITGIDPSLAIESIATMDERIADSVAPRRFSTITIAAFAGGAMLLAALGLYGLLAFTVAERRREIAVRLALGAEPQAIVRMVIWQGLTLVGFGMVAGAVAALAVGNAAASLLYGTERYDSVTFSIVPLVLVATTLVACALPAYRAARVESLVALRAE
jgi:putative ABC transport system permease protein